MIIVFLVSVLFCAIFLGFTFFFYTIVQGFALPFLPKTIFHHHNSFEIDTEDRDIPLVALVQKRAFIHCDAERITKKRETNFIGINDCVLLKKQYDNTTTCIWGCIGFGNCARICPQKAIVMKNNTAIVTDLCDGCGKCIAVCPNSLIALIPHNAAAVIPCSAQDKEKSLEICSSACTGCKNCISKKSPNEIALKNNCAHLNYSALKDFPAEQAEKCPQTCIKKYEKNEKKHFYFWKIYYTIMNKFYKTTVKDEKIV